MGDAAVGVGLSEVLKRRTPGAKFVGQYSHSPNVSFEVVGRALHHFGREVVEGSTESVPASLGVDCPPEVCQFDRVVAHQYVFRFDVAVNDAARVQMLQPLQHLPHDDAH